MARVIFFLLFRKKELRALVFIFIVHNEFLLYGHIILYNPFSWNESKENKDRMQHYLRRN